MGTKNPSSKPPPALNILLADDESSVLEVTALMLKRLGCQVHMAGDAYQALEEFKKYGENIDLVMLDYFMPGMNGVEAYDKLRERNKDIKVVFTSGYGEEEIFPSGGLPSSARFMSKPFNLGDLKKMVDCLSAGKQVNGEGKALGPGSLAC